MTALRNYNFCCLASCCGKTWPIYWLPCYWRWYAARALGQPCLQCQPRRLSACPLYMFKRSL